MTICHITGCQEHYGCRLRNKGIQLSPAATMSRTQNWVATPSTPSSIDGAILYDERPGGIKMPILDHDGQTIRHRQYVERRAEIDGKIRSVRSGQVDLTQMTGDSNG